MTLKPDGLSDENWARLKDKIRWPSITTVDDGLKLTSWAQLDAIINIAVAAARAEAERERRLREALSGFADDFMTSEKHHPGYVLISTAVFERVCAALSEEEA